MDNGALLLVIFLGTSHGNCSVTMDTWVRVTHFITTNCSWRHKMAPASLRRNGMSIKQNNGITTSAIIHLNLNGQCTGPQSACVPFWKARDSNPNLLLSLPGSGMTRVIVTSSVPQGRAASQQINTWASDGFSESVTWGCITHCWLIFNQLSSQYLTLKPSWRAPVRFTVESIASHKFSLNFSTI